MVFYGNLWPKYVSNILNQSILDNIISLAHEALEILSKFVVPITGWTFDGCLRIQEINNWSFEALYLVDNSSSRMLTLLLFSDSFL